VNTPTVNLVIAAQTPLGCSPDDLLRSLDGYVRDHLGPAWGVGAQLRLAEQAEGWTLYLIDDADQAGALGYHDDPGGLPRGFVGVRDCLRHGEAVCAVASHELAELLCDPAGNLAVMTPRGRFAALEVCDPVERLTFDVRGLPCSDFVYPAWFGLPGDGARYDHLGVCSQPWEVLSGGYIPVCEAGRWSNVFGSLAAGERFTAKDRRLHRTERRGRRLAGLTSDRSPSVVA
jgi:hypothetical protein